jgi:uncharacterized protein (TIGR02271 family)
LNRVRNGFPGPVLVRLNPLFQQEKLMSRTLTALFDSHQEAEAAKARLQASNIDISRVDIHGSGTSGSTTGGTTTGGTTTGGGGFLSGLKHMVLPENDRHTYEEGIRRGGALLTAQVEEGQEDDAVRILEEAQSIDVDERSEQWRASGWAPGAAATGATAGTLGAYGSGNANRSDRIGTDRIGGEAVAEEHIPIVEEELRVGKREVNRGGVRVRSYVVEQPVHEQVSLREEHVEVERRAVNEPLGAVAADAFQERSIEMTETSEEAVVAKQAQVREELVVRKDVEQHVEQIDDTVRRTEVEVEDLGTTSRDLNRDKDRF